MEGKVTPDFAGIVAVAEKVNANGQVYTLEAFKEFLPDSTAESQVDCTVPVFIVSNLFSRKEIGVAELWLDGKNVHAALYLDSQVSEILGKAIDLLGCKVYGGFIGETDDLLTSSIIRKVKPHGVEFRLYPLDPSNSVRGLLSKV